MEVANLSLFNWGGMEEILLPLEQLDDESLNAVAKTSWAGYQCVSLIRKKRVKDLSQFDVPNQPQDPYSTCISERIYSLKAKIESSDYVSYQMVSTINKLTQAIHLKNAYCSSCPGKNPSCSLDQFVRILRAMNVYDELTDEQFFRRAYHLGTHNLALFIPTAVKATGELLIINYVQSFYEKNNRQFNSVTLTSELFNSYTLSEIFNAVFMPKRSKKLQSLSHAGIGVYVSMKDVQENMKMRVVYANSGKKSNARPS
ncbi:MULTISPECIES: hypothetical protein [Parachlamydia]|uniref:hypothetical protein n=1 Tax=Parachlamydia TaxID=83551 RepID=UPI0001C17B76|nr:hypothetical protein [Parachlamydia acanthamoebae]EFB42462.1 hypothetical protein pah_c008o087 [Parachlamydia acanthamoebae str. Hall's coccus]